MIEHAITIDCPTSKPLIPANILIAFVPIIKRNNFNNDVDVLIHSYKKLQACPYKYSTKIQYLLMLQKCCERFSVKLL